MQKVKESKIHQFMNNLMLQSDKVYVRFINVLYEQVVLYRRRFSRRMSSARKRGQNSVFVTVGTTQFEKLTDYVCSSAVLKVSSIPWFS